MINYNRSVGGGNGAGLREEHAQQQHRAEKALRQRHLQVCPGILTINATVL
jgi:hypothetical protein